MATIVGEIRLDTTKLDRIIREAPRRAAEIVKGGAFAVQGKAADMAPVDTGALKNSIQAMLHTTLEWEVHDGMEYGIYQEFGTNKMAAHPFMRPALEWARPQIIKQWNELCK